MKVSFDQWKDHVRTSISKAYRHWLRHHHPDKNSSKLEISLIKYHGTMLQETVFEETTEIWEYMYGLAQLFRERKAFFN